eukprot:scaffold180571_cov37-Tisochrysis_lutea.AAC.4
MHIRMSHKLDTVPAPPYDAFNPKPAAISQQQLAIANHYALHMLLVGSRPRLSHPGRTYLESHEEWNPHTGNDVVFYERCGAVMGHLFTS